MQKIELIPDLEHCIETVAKREYELVLSNYSHGSGEIKDWKRSWSFSGFS